MEQSLEAARASSGDYLRLRLSFWGLSGALLFLCYALVFETTHFPPIVILVVIALCGGLLYNTHSRLRLFDFDQEEPRRDRPLPRPGSWVSDYRFSDETQRKVQKALNSAPLNSAAKTPNGFGRLQGPTLGDQRAGGPAFGVSPSSTTFGTGFEPVGLRTPGASKDYRKVFLDNVPNGWTTVVKQDDPFSPFVKDASVLRFSGARPTEEPTFPQRGKTETLDARRSVTNPTQSRAKTSLASRQEALFEGDRLDRQLQEAEGEQEQLLREFSVDQHEFSLWAQHNLATWLARSVIPDLLLRNFANLKAIHVNLSLFRLELAEFHCLNCFADDDWTCERFEFERRKSTRKFFDADQFLRCHANDFADFKKIAPQSPAQLPNFQATLDAMAALAQERLLLDLFFGDQGSVRNELRMAKLRRLYQIKDDGFRFVQEGLNDGLRDDDLLLDLIVQTIREQDGFYKSHRTFRRNFITPLLRNIEVDPDDFYVEKGGQFLLLILAKRRTKFVFDLDGVFRLGVFLIHFVQDRHRAFLRSMSQSPLAEVIKNLDVRKRLS